MILLWPTDQSCEEQLVVTEMVIICNKWQISANPDMPPRCFNNSSSQGLSDASNFTCSKKINLKNQADNKAQAGSLFFSLI